MLESATTGAVGSIAVRSRDLNPVGDDDIVYCDESGEPFVTAAPDEERKDRRVELCSGCGNYLKTVDLQEFSPFPLLAIADLETMDLDMAAMEHGFTRPPLKDFKTRQA